MPKKTHRYRVKAKVRSSIQYDDEYMICKPKEVTDKKVKKWILKDINSLLEYGGNDIEKQDIEISNIEIEDLGHCTEEDFY